MEDTAHRLVSYHINPIPPNMVTLAEIVARLRQDDAAGV